MSGLWVLDFLGAEIFLASNYLKSDSILKSKYVPSNCCRNVCGFLDELFDIIQLHLAI